MIPPTWTPLRTSLAVYRNGMIRHVLDDYPARRASEPDALFALAPLVEV